MNVNHDPNSIVSFHNDGSPVQSQLTLTFKEIEYVVSDESASVAVTQAANEIVRQANAAAFREEQIARNTAAGRTPAAGRVAALRGFEE